MEVESLPNGRLFSLRSMPSLGQNLNKVTTTSRAVESSPVAKVLENGRNSENNTWKGQGGGKNSLHSVQFDKQMDKISLWLEEWDHQTVSFHGTTLCFSKP